MLDEFSNSLSARHDSLTVARIHWGPVRGAPFFFEEPSRCPINPQQEGGSAEGWHVAWLSFKDLAQSVRDDVERIRNHPLTPDSIPVHGFIYDVKNGALVPVEADLSA